MKRYVNGPVIVGIPFAFSLDAEKIHHAIELDIVFFPATTALL